MGFIPDCHAQNTSTESIHLGFSMYSGAPQAVPRGSEGTEIQQRKLISSACIHDLIISATAQTCGRSWPESEIESLSPFRLR